VLLTRAVTLETTSNFQNIKDLLMGFVNSVVLVLHQRLQPQREQIWETILNVSCTDLGGHLNVNSADLRDQSDCELNRCFNRSRSQFKCGLKV